MKIEQGVACCHLIDGTNPEAKSSGADAPRAGSPAPQGGLDLHSRARVRSAITVNSISRNRAARSEVPGQVMKRRKKAKQTGGPHLVPLARQAKGYFAGLRELTGHSRYCFPGAGRDGKEPTPGSRSGPWMSETTMNVAIQRMGYQRKMVSHGFRATAMTLGRERLHIPKDYLDLQLAHKIKDPHGNAYDRAAFMAERREMMQRWADYLDELRIGALRERSA